MSLASKSPIVIAIAGAKGGVGKSMVCSNLAIQFAKAGLSTLLIDLDLGAGNQHTLLGVSRSCPDWTQWLLKDHQPLQQFAEPTQQQHLKLLAACGYHPGMADALKEQKTKLLLELRNLDADVVLVDLGAGSHKMTLDFFNSADIKIIVSTTESTSLLNNFEFLKNALYQSFVPLLNHDDKHRALLKEYQSADRLKVDDFIRHVAQVDSAMAEMLQEAAMQFRVSVIFNQVRKIEEVHQVMRLKRLVQKHLGIDLSYPGFIFFSEEVVASMQKKLPISYISPQSIVTQIFERIATSLIKDLATSESFTLSLQQIQQDFYKNRVERKKAHHLL